MPGEGEAPFLESQRFISRGLGLALLFVAVLTVALHLQIAPAWAWGILGSAKRRAYTVRGTGAVKLTLSKGGTLLIGTQRPEELARAIRAASGLSVP